MPNKCQYKYLMKIVKYLRFFVFELQQNIKIDFVDKIDDMQTLPLFRFF